MSLISIGLSGLTASSAAISTIGNNTANVDTKGYSRQQVMTTASLQQNMGAGYIGSGTTLSDVRRIYNSYLDAQLQTSTALGADATAFSTQASKTDTLLSDTATGVSTVLAKFFTDLQTVSGKATDSASRTTLLATAASLTSRFNSIAAQLTSQNDTINTQLTAQAAQVNQLSSTIASLNKQITAANATGASPNTLLDSRNESVRQLNELVGAKVVENNGNYDIYIGTGQSLVSGATAYTMTAGPSSDDPSHYNLKVSQGQTTTDVTSVVTGGSIGGLLRYREDVMVPASNELGRVALVLADKVNSQLAQGVDANGDFGANLFKSINDSTLVTQRSVGDSRNTAGSGNLNVDISDSSKLTGDDYQVTFTDGDTSATPPVAGDNFTVRRLPDGAVVGTGKLSDNPPTVFEGFKVSLNGGNLSKGDTFKVSPTRNGASGIAVVMTDAKTLATAAPLTASVGASSTGTGTFTQPVLSSSTSIYDKTATTDMQNAVEANAPLKVLFGAVAADGTQSYSLLDVKGNPVMKPDGVTPITGVVTRGQTTPQEFDIGYTDSAGAAQTYKISMSFSGSPAANDTFSIALTGAGSSDNRNALAALELQTKQTVGVSGTGTGTSISSTYASLVSSVGTQAAQGKSDVIATTAVVAAASGARDAVSGVSLDEEAANLVKYQQYYTASSQIIKAAQTIFSTLINSL